MAEDNTKLKEEDNHTGTRNWDDPIKKQ